MSYDKYSVRLHEHLRGRCFVWMLIYMAYLYWFAYWV